MPGSTAASSSARRASSWPTTALKGKRARELTVLRPGIGVALSCPLFLPALRLQHGVDQSLAGRVGRVPHASPMCF